MNKTKVPWYKTTTTKAILVILSTCFSVWMALDNQNIKREMQITQDLLLYQDAKKDNALKNTAQKLEAEYLKLKKKEREYIAHCKIRNCELPINLSTAEPDLNYIPPEAIYAGKVNIEDK